MLTGDQLTRSLIREFMIRKNMNSTIKQFDLEFSERLPPISKIEIIRNLCMERLVRNNKEKINPRQTLLEMLVDYLISKSQSYSKFGGSTVPLSGSTLPLSVSNSRINEQVISQSIIEVVTYQSQSNLLQPNQNEQKPTQGNYDHIQKGSRLDRMKKAPAKESNHYHMSYEQSNQSTSDLQNKPQNPQQQQIRSSSEVGLQQPKIIAPLQVSESTKVKTIEPSQNHEQIPSNNIQQKNQANLSIENDHREFDFDQKTFQSSEIKVEAPKKLEQQGKMINLSRRPLSGKQVVETQAQEKIEIENLNTSHQINSRVSQDNTEIAYISMDINNFSDVEIRSEDKQIKINYLQPQNTMLDNNRKRRQQPQQIDSTLLKSMKDCIFANSGFSSLPKSWGQGFIMQNEKSFYGLLQKEGGPCGVIASVQAYYLKHFLIVGKGNDKSDQYFKTNCLIAALADILFKVAKLGTNNITIAIASRQSNPDEAISLDSCDQLVFQAKSLESTYDNLYELKDLFVGNGNQGVTLFFYSVILTKGIDKIREEMDNSDNTLIGNHGHCTQEMVNLLLTGRAISNCFDGDKTLDENYVLHGIVEQSEFGFLTIFEHFKYMEVGSYLKSPYYPIWIVCKEYHYSVIFSNQSNALMQSSIQDNKLKQFDIIFYDELHAADDMIRLTIRRKGAQLGDAKKKMVLEGGLTFNLGGDDGLQPSLELVLGTKWGTDIEVDWNDSMPIL